MNQTFQTLSASNGLPDYLTAILIFAVTLTMAALLRRAVRSPKLERGGPWTTLLERAVTQAIVPTLRLGAFFFAVEHLAHAFHRLAGGLVHTQRHHLVPARREGLGDVAELPRKVLVDEQETHGGEA